MKQDEKEIHLVRDRGVDCPRPDCSFRVFGCWFGGRCRQDRAVDVLFGVAIVSYVALVSTLAWAWYESTR